MTPSAGEGRRKDPDRTRRRLLEAAFHEIHKSGFQAASLDRILRAAGVTKGALYHHFENKTSLGYAVVDEVLGGHICAFAEELARAREPSDALREWVLSPPRLPLRLGCPVNNLALEMSPLDEGFRARIEAVFRRWREAIAVALARGQAEGSVRRDLDVERAASFVLAALEGSVSLAKSAQSEVLFASNMGVLAEWLDSLRPERGGKANVVDRGRSSPEV